MIRKNVAKGVIDFAIALASPLSPLSSEYFTPHCYSDGLKRPKGMTVEIAGFCLHSNNVNNNHYRGREKDNALLKGFNDHHIKSTCFVSAIFWELSLPLIFKNNNLFSDRNLTSSSNRTHVFFNSAFLLQRSPEVIAYNNSTIFLTNILTNIYFTHICLTDQFYKFISNVNSCFYLFYYFVCLNLFRFFELFKTDLNFYEFTAQHYL